MTEAWKQWEGRVVDGRFALRRYLGGSDHSAVFLTERGTLPGKAAIKLVPAGADAEQQLTRWRQAAGVSHPHLLRLFEMGRTRLDDAEVLYLVMEYAEEDLGQVLPQRALTPAEAREMLAPVLKALAHIHGRNLVHAALKPANILAVNDQVKLSSDSLRTEGDLLPAGASPDPHAPPEAVAWRAGDVWSLGVTLTQALTQRLPEWKEGRPDAVLPAPLPEPFHEIVRLCLQREPQRRAAISDIVMRLQPAAPPHAKAMTPPAQSPARPVPAQPWAAWAKPRYLLPAAVAALAVLAVLAGAKLFGDRSEAQSAPSAAGDPAAPATPQPAPQKQGPAGTPSATAPASPRVPGAVVERVLPRVSQSALDTVRGTIRVVVRVEVDTAGQVTQADFDLTGPSRYFASRSLEAAEAWKFRPPTVGGRPVPSVWRLRFEFTTTGVRAVPEQ